MAEELGLNRPGWRFLYADPASREIVAQLKQGAGRLELFKTTTGRRRIYIFAPAASQEQFLVKAYLPAKLAKRLKYLWRNSRCRQEYVAAEKLARLGIPAVKALAFGCRSSGLLPAEELVIEPYLEKAENFQQRWSKSGSGQNQELFAALAGLVALMHDKGVLQRDFKPDSILIKQAAGKIELILADLERIRLQRRPLSTSRRVENLGKIIQSFFRAAYCPELDFLLEQYSKQSGLEFSRGQLRVRAMLGGVRQAKKQAEARKSWAKASNELIEKFEFTGATVRMSRELERDAIEKFLARMPARGPWEISGKQLEIIPVKNAQSAMEKYFYLRELRVRCRPVLLAVDFHAGNKALVGIAQEPGAVPLQEFLTRLSDPDQEKFFTSLGHYLFRTDLLGLLNPSPANNLLVKPSADTYEFIISRPDLLTSSSPSHANIHSFENSRQAQRLSEELTPGEEQIALLKKGFESGRQKLG